MLMLFVVVVVVVVANDVKKVYSKYVPGVLEVYKGKQVPLLIGRLLWAFFRVNKFQGPPLCPFFWKRKNKSQQTSSPCLGGPNGPTERPDRTGTKNDRTYCDWWLVLRVLRYSPRGLRGHGEDTWDDMGARDGEYVAAIGPTYGRSHALWPWPNQEAHEGGKTRWRTRRSRHISSKIAELMFIETPGILVEPRRRYSNF